jgi:hypothetical protein
MYHLRFQPFIAAALLSLATPTFAMLLGDLNVTSFIGDPLQIRIAVSTDDDSSLRNDCFHLVGPSSHTAPLDGARLGLVSINGKRYVSIHTREPVYDPILDLTLSTDGCGATMEKDFVALLMPRMVSADDDSSVVIPSAASPDMAQTTTPAYSAPKVRSNKINRNRKPRSQQHHTVHKPKHHRVAAKAQRREPFPKNKSRFILRLDYGFGSLGHYAEQVAKQKQQIQNPAAMKSTSTQTSLGDKLVLQPPGQSALQGPPLNVAPTAAGTAAQPSNAGGVNPQTNGSGRNSTAPGGVIDGLPKPVPNTSSEPWYRGIFSSLNLLLLVLFIVMLIALWLKKSAPSSRFLDKTQPDFNPFRPAQTEDTELHPLLFGNATPVNNPGLNEPINVETETKTTPVPKPTPKLADSFKPKPDITKATSPVLDDRETHSPKLTPMADLAVEQFDSADHALELAEVMLAFGRSNQAIDTLSQFIRNHPDQTAEPWLKLLDLYFKSNLRNEFESLATDLHKHFNVAIADWNDFERHNDTSVEHGALTLESLEHIMDRLTSTWGTPACLDYLEKLIIDNRGGQRIGFPLPLVRDILLLRDVLRQTSPVPTPIH